MSGGEASRTVSREAVLEVIRRQGDHARVEAARQSLPENIDPVREAQLLARFGVDPQSVFDQVGGAGGTPPAVGEDSGR